MSLHLPVKALNDWTIKPTSINDNLNDVRFFGNCGVIIGNHGLYYNTTGADNPSGWKKYIIRTSVSDSTLLSATKFVQLAFTGQSRIFFAIGNDTVSNRAVFFRLDLNDSSYSFPFVGNTGSRLNSVAAVNYYSSTGYIVAVGNQGLVVSYVLATNTISQSVFHEYANLQLIYSRSRYNGHAAVISNDSIFPGTASTNFVSDFGQTLGRHVNDAFGDDNGSYVYSLDSQAVYNTFITSSLHLENTMYYKPANIRFHSISSASAAALKYIATDHGIYKIFPNTILEYQPGSLGLAVNKIWFNQYAAFDTGYAVGANGLLLKTVNLGGPVKPYVQLTTADGGCVNEYFSLSNNRSTSNSCKWYIDGSYIQDFCGTSSYLFSSIGSHELKYIVTNADGLSDTSIKIINITAKPQINLPYVVTDTILCKTEPIQIQISNTQNGHKYTLIQAGTGNAFGNVTSNGGSVTLTSNYISDSGFYFIRATNITSGCSADFTNKTFIKVEKTKSRFSTDKINVTVGEKFNLFNNSTDAATFQWTLQQDPNISTSTAANPQGIFYASIGQKTLTLISTSQYGCKDTLTAADGAFVYIKPTPADKCYALNVNDSDYSYIYTSYPSVGLPTILNDNGYIVPGYGNKALVYSRYGNNRKLKKSMSTYLAKYSEDGALKWMHYIDTLGTFTGSETDPQGSIYVIGYCNTRSWYHFNNGDSMQISITNTDTLYPGSSATSQNGFLLKLDSTGRYLWHTVFDDNSNYFQGYQVQGGLPNRIMVKNGEIFITGKFLAHLTYVRNDSTVRLFTLTNTIDPNLNQNKFLVKIRPDGFLAWKSYGHYNTTNSTDPADIAAGPNGDVMFVSDFETGVKFYDNDSTLIVNETGVTASNRSFLMRMNSTGHLVWKAIIETQASNYFCKFSHIASDNSGSAYITGKIQNYSTTTPLQITNANSSISITDTLSGFLILKFDKNGQYQWSVGSKNPYYGLGSAITNKGAYIYATGTIRNNGQTVSNFTITSTNGINTTDNFIDNEFFIVKYDTAGVLKNLAKSGDNPGGYMQPGGLTLDSANSFIITGIADYNYASISNHTIFNQPFQTNGIDVFFAKLSADFCANCDHVSWTGIVNTAWDNPQNWSCNAVPGSTSQVTIPGTAPHMPVITGSQSFEVWSLDIQTGATMTIQTGGTLHILH